MLPSEIAAKLAALPDKHPDGSPVKVFFKADFGCNIDEVCDQVKTFRLANANDSAFGIKRGDVFLGNGEEWE
jgi:hypothetical protein